MPQEKSASPLACTGRIVRESQADPQRARLLENTGRSRIDQRASLEAIIFRHAPAARATAFPRNSLMSICASHLKGGSSLGFWIGSGRSPARGVRERRQDELGVASGGWAIARSGDIFGKG